MSKPEEAATAVGSRFNKELPDILIQNAGISQRSAAADTPFENEKQIMVVNVMSVIATTKAILPQLVKKGVGQIVIMNSISGKLGVPMRTSYSASKHALLGYFDALRSELAGTGVEVTTICPGYVQTGVSKNALGAQAGKSFGQTDSNIRKGLTVQNFCEKAVRSIYLREKESIIPSDLLFQRTGIFLRNIYSALVFRIMAKMTKQQLAAMKAAE